MLNEKRKIWTIFSAILLALLEYHCVIWYQLDLPVYIYENGSELTLILRRLTQTDNPLFQVIAIAALYKLNVSFLERGIHYLEKNDWIISFLFSCVIVVGYSYDQVNSPVLLSGNSVLRAGAAGCLLCCWLLTVALISVLRLFFRNPVRKKWNLLRVWERHPFLFPAAMLFLAWLPYALVRYPAGMEYDAFYQIQQVLTGELQTNNPLISTLFFGYGFVLGRGLFGSINAGLFFVVVCQMILCACMDAYAMLVVYRKKGASQTLMGILLVYALTPFIARYTTSIVKDALYSHAVLFFWLLWWTSRIAM